ncbi:MAG: 50S ribosomal protein L25, partial [Chloroflexota bacterium]
MTTSAADQVQLPARVRHALGKRVRFLRRQGLTPARLYGSGIDSLSVEVETAVLQKVLAKVGRSAPVSVMVEGDAEKHLAFVSGLQRDPVTSSII